MTLRVLVVTPWFPSEPTDPGGNFVLHSVQALCDAGVDVSVIVTRPWTPRIFAALHPDWDRPRLRESAFNPALNLSVSYYPSLPRSRWNELAGPLYRVGTRGSIVRRARRWVPQVIHAHTEMVGYAVQPIASDLGLPLLITLHGINTESRLLDTSWKRRRLRNALDAAARVVIVGEPLRAFFGGLGGRKDHYRVVPNGYALPELDIETSRGAEDVALRWISVSNLHEGKGIDVALQAFGMLMRGGQHNWTYEIVGDGDERPRLEAMTDALGLRGRVRFRGKLPHDEAMRVMSRADVFVLPSYREAFGIAYLEAMALGLLAIGVCGQGPEAFIGHERTGLLVPPNDAAALCDTMIAVLKSPTHMREIAAAGQRHVRAEFTWAAHAAKLLAVYHEAIDAR